MAVFVRKLFGIGKLPADLRAQVEAEGLIYLAEYVAVTRRFSGVIPGLRSAGSVGSYVGSLAFTSQRVLGTLSVVPKLAGRAVDVRWDEAHDRRGEGRDLVDGSATRSRRRRGRPEVQRPAVAALQRRHPRRRAGPVCRADRWPSTCRPNTSSARSASPIVRDRDPRPGRLTQHRQAADHRRQQAGEHADQRDSVAVDGRHPAASPSRTTNTPTRPLAPGSR